MLIIWLFMLTVNVMLIMGLTMLTSMFGMDEICVLFKLQVF